MIIEFYDFRRCSDNDFMQHNFSDSNKFQEIRTKSANYLRNLWRFSGLTDVDSKTMLMCRMNWVMSLFMTLKNCTIIEQITFEGQKETLKKRLTRVGDDMYALRSDRTMFKIVFNENGKPDVQQIDTKSRHWTMKDFAMMKKHNRLLLKTKGKYTDKTFEKKFQAIYAFELLQKRWLKKPFCKFRFRGFDFGASLKIRAFRTQERRFGWSEIQIQHRQHRRHPEKDYYLSTPNSFYWRWMGRANRSTFTHLTTKCSPNRRGIHFSGWKFIGNFFGR